MAYNLAQPCALVALMVVKRPKAWVDAVALRKSSAICMNRRALEDDFPVDEEAFAFGSFRLIPAQRTLLEDGNPLRLGTPGGL